MATLEALETAVRGTQTLAVVEEQAAQVQVLAATAEGQTAQTVLLARLQTALKVEVHNLVTLASAYQLPTAVSVAAVAVETLALVAEATLEDGTIGTTAVIVRAVEDLHLTAVQISQTR
jgi:hypothetical protein